MKIFISHYSGEIAGEEWRDRVIKEAKENHLEIALLSPESIGNPWIQFESGLATARNEPCIVPTIFGGLKKAHVPSTLTNWQILDLADEKQFDAILLKIFKGHYDQNNPPKLRLFLASSDPSIVRMIRYGPLAAWLENKIVTKHHKSFTLVQGADKKYFEIFKGGKRVSSIRMRIRPRSVGVVSQWKC